MLVVPTSRRVHPHWVMMSGMRKDPPISTSSPREVMTSPPLPMALRMRSTAAALLLTTMAASAPVTSARRLSTWLCLEPRLPLSTSYSRVE